MPFIPSKKLNPKSNLALIRQSLPQIIHTIPTHGQAQHCTPAQVIGAEVNGTEPSSRIHRGPELDKA